MNMLTTEIYIATQHPSSLRPAYHFLPAGSLSICTSFGCRGIPPPPHKYWINIECLGFVSPSPDELIAFFFCVCFVFHHPGN